METHALSTGIEVLCLDSARNLCHHILERSTRVIGSNARETLECSSVGCIDNGLEVVFSRSLRSELGSIRSLGHSG